MELGGARDWHDPRLLGKQPGERYLGRHRLLAYRDLTKQIDQGLVCLQEAYVQGVSTRSVDDLVKAMDGSGVSKSQVSRLCAEIDERVKAFLDRPLEGDWAYVWIDATYVKVRQNGRVVSVAVIVAVGVNGDGRREVLGMDVGPSEGPTATRAVGLANGANPIAIFVPCHRVIGANASLTGYGGGLERKRWLLAHEQARPASADGLGDGIQL